jgi:hypothetical protein
MQRQELILELLHHSKKDDKIKNYQIPDPLSAGSQKDGMDNRHFLYRLYDVIIYEFNSTIPAMISAGVHCIAHIALYELMYYILHELKQILPRLIKGLPPFFVKSGFDGMLFILGAITMRSTGDLFWWCSEQDYECMQFDYPNRIRMKFWDARLMKFMRSSDVLRCTFFTLGYYLCYIGLYPFYTLLSGIYDEKSKLLMGLPSRNMTHGFCLDEIFSTRTLSEELERIGKIK